MPKLTVSLLIERLQQRINELEDGASFEARDINALLSDEQQIELKRLWAEQQGLRKKHRPPKSLADQQAIGWKTIREVRIEIYKMALAEAKGSLLTSLKLDQQRSEIKSAETFMNAFSSAKAEGKNAISAANIATRRAGFQPPLMSPDRGRKAKQRDELVQQMEDELRGEKGTDD